MIKTGVQYMGNNHCRFSIWAPQKKSMLLHLIHPVQERIEMEKDRQGCFFVELDYAGPGSHYFFIPEGGMDYPDPASHFQPEGVHGPSEVVDHSSFRWTDDQWKGIPFKKLILYEVHVGTFTKEGTFEAMIPRLPELAASGINALELLPVSQFPGERNWGYDGVFPYAVQNSYGGPNGLKKLVNACHENGMAVFLDVVYNHIGPEGNYFGFFGPYFTNKYRTPWGEAINFDGDWSDGVRAYFSDNPLFWFSNYHIDGLRCDAVHEIFDRGAIHLWNLTVQKIREMDEQTGRTHYLIAESDLNSPRVVGLPETGGFGFTAQWLDDFHHALYVLLDKKGKKHYRDFGEIGQLAKAYTDGFVHSGEYVSFRKRRHGTSSAGVAGDKFVVFSQNHDQVGNRAMAERLSVLVDFERLKLAAAAILLSPYIPLLFMGEEYGEVSPFFYFVSHSDVNLIRAVREGRKQDFGKFKWGQESPDPQDIKTFESSRLQWHKRTEGKHLILLKWHTALIHLRQNHPILQEFNKNNVWVNVVAPETLVLYRQNAEGSERLICLLNFSETAVPFTFPDGEWEKILDSTGPEWLENTSGRPASSLPDSGSSDGIILAPLSVTLFQGPLP